MAVGGHGGGAPWCVGSVFPAPQLLTATSALPLGPLFFERIGGPQQLLSTGYPPRLLDDDHSSGVSQVTVFFFFFFCFTLWGTSAATFPADFPAHNLQSLSFLPPSQSPFLFSFLPDLKSNGLSYVCPLLQKLILE
jgi:hypothetical protein